LHFLIYKKAHHDAVDEKLFLGAKARSWAYMEKERQRAEAHNYISPIQPTKKHRTKHLIHALEFYITHLDKAIDDVWLIMNE